MTKIILFLVPITEIILFLVPNKMIWTSVLSVSSGRVVMREAGGRPDPMWWYL